MYAIFDRGGLQRCLVEVPDQMEGQASMKGQTERRDHLICCARGGAQGASCPVGFRSQEALQSCQDSRAQHSRPLLFSGSSWIEMFASAFVAAHGAIVGFVSILGWDSARLGGCAPNLFLFAPYRSCAFLLRELFSILSRMPHVWKAFPVAKPCLLQGSLISVPGPYSGPRVHSAALLSTTMNSSVRCASVSDSSITERKIFIYIYTCTVYSI